jgi:hypothetical protein
VLNSILLSACLYFMAKAHLAGNDRADVAFAKGVYTGYLPNSGYTRESHGGETV